MIKNLAALRAQFSTRPPAPTQFAEGHPCRLNHLSLEQQKKRARDLLKQWRAGNDPQEQQRKLSDAQHVIAKGYGFKTWAQLKTYIEQARLAREAVAEGRPVTPDTALQTLHIRCGSDIEYPLAVAGFGGDFLNVPDPYVHGPVIETATREEFIQLRATYLSHAYQPDYEQVLADLTQIAHELDTARDYDAVCLWFEHDPHDQLMLAGLLDFFHAPAQRPPLLKMINITHFPGVERFNGIGQLPPEAMPLLWDQFAEVTEAQYAVGKQAWAAIRSSTPQPLIDLVATGTPAMPTMARALDRFLKQLPSKRNGLNLTENLTLQILTERGPTNAARLFGAYTNTYEPLAFMGDSGYWQVLDDLAQAAHPAVVMEKQGEKPNTWQIALTDFGRELVENKQDWLELNHVDRWVGGIHINSQSEPVFRIDG
ncbi:MAG: DUF1835 domain-containing protein [Gammaproteobacteria bacterium]|nr:DUF1835 domain-containing protein [Gammaproteobacteria bacterium]MDH5650552.1 DUF1835 domain-containing protein [Gammaproteobacteria bacterium]